jgi:hypothetical protein
MNIGANIGSVIAAAVGSSSLLTGFVLHLVGAKLPMFVEHEEGVLLSSGLAKLTRPEDKAALKAILVALRARFPDAGDAVFAVAADACIKEAPALAPYRTDLISLFSGIEQAAASGIDAETK